jgi:hypothetical protein
MKCEICQKEYKDFNALSNHITSVHKDITKKEYYLKYINKDENFSIICPYCNVKEKKFESLPKGFKGNCCDKKCSVLQTKDTNKIKTGHECNLHGKDKDKITQIFIEKYNSTTALGNKEIHDKGVQKLKQIDEEGFTGYDKRQIEINKTVKKIYNVSNVSQVEEFKIKGKKTKEDLYDDENYNNREKAKQTCLEEYNVENVANIPGVQDKIEETNLIKINVRRPTQNKDISKKSVEKKRNNIDENGLNSYDRVGIKNKERNKNRSEQEWNEIVKGIYLTKKKNGTLAKSSTEIKIFEILKEYFGKDDILDQYRDEERYPFNCDFYIRSKDLFIEANINFTHGFKPFEGSKEDIEVLKEWKKKSEELNFKGKEKKYYLNAIYTWSISDVKKRTIAKQNNLNYIEIFHFENEEQIIKRIYRYLYGLSYEYNKNELIKEFNYIMNKSGDYLANNCFNKIILTYHNKFFYKKENELFKYSIIQNKLIKNRMNYLNKKENELTDKELLRGFKISGIYSGFSHFSPLWIKAFIEEFNIKSIYDPCMGWGHRLLGSWNINYIGNDIDFNIVENNKKIYEDFKNNDMIKIFYNYDSSEFIPEEKYEAVFTCPPYFKTEKYFNNNTSTNKYSNYNDWLNIWWKKTVKNSIINCEKYFSFIINEKYKEDMKKICIEENLIFLKEIKIGNNKINHFRRKKKLNKNLEYLIIFFK